MTPGLSLAIVSQLMQLARGETHKTVFFRDEKPERPGMDSQRVFWVFTRASLPISTAGNQTRDTSLNLLLSRFCVDEVIEQGGEVATAW